MLTLLLTACAGDSPAPGGETEVFAPAKGPGQVAAAVVAMTLGIEPTAVRVLEIEQTIFGDASLDCPEPGMAYAQVLTPGYRVLAEADGRRFDVRVSGQSGRICHQRRRVAPPLPPGEDATALARASLAALAGTREDAIRVVGSQPLEPGVAVADCEACPAGSVDCGTLVELALEDRRYRFRVVDGAAEPCTPWSRR